MLFVEQAVDRRSPRRASSPRPSTRARACSTRRSRSSTSRSARYNCLKRQGVNTIGQLTECSENDLLNIRNFGAKSIEEVKDKLQQMGLGLKQ